MGDASAQQSRDVGCTDRGVTAAAGVSHVVVRWWHG